MSRKPSSLSAAKTYLKEQCKLLKISQKGTIKQLLVKVLKHLEYPDKPRKVDKNTEETTPRQTTKMKQETTPVQTKVKQTSNLTSAPGSTPEIPLDSKLYPAQLYVDQDHNGDIEMAQNNPRYVKGRAGRVKFMIPDRRFTKARDGMPRIRWVMYKPNPKK